MKKATISFTQTLKGMQDGTVNIDEIDFIYVGCYLIHLPHPKSSLLPCELAWCRIDGDPVRLIGDQDHLISRDQLSIRQIGLYEKLWSRMTKVPVYHVEDYWGTAVWLLKNNSVDQVYMNKWWDKETIPNDNRWFNEEENFLIKIENC